MTEPEQKIRIAPERDTSVPPTEEERKRKRRLTFFIIKCALVIIVILLILWGITSCINALTSGSTSTAAPDLLGSRMLLAAQGTAALHAHICS